MKKIQRKQIITGSDIVRMIEDADLAVETKRRYFGILEKYLRFGGDPLSEQDISDFSTMQTVACNGRFKAVVGLYTSVIISRLKAIPGYKKDVYALAEMYMAIELREAIEYGRIVDSGHKRIWLSEEQVKTMLDTCDGSPRGMRDGLVIALLARAGLRRSEAVNLTFADVKVIPGGGIYITALKFLGKGKGKRQVHLTGDVASRIDMWASYMGGGGKILRSFMQRRGLRESMSGAAIYNVVKAKGAMIGEPDLSPHDLRRTFSQLMLKGGSNFTDVKNVMGHKVGKINCAYFI